MDRDAQIAAMIRGEIEKETAERQRLSYRVGSPEDAYHQGRIVGLRLALAFVDPNQQR